MSDHVAIAVTRADGSVAIMQFVTRGRSPGLPAGARWELASGDYEGEQAALEALRAASGEREAAGDAPEAAERRAAAQKAELDAVTKIRAYVADRTGFWLRSATAELVAGEVVKTLADGVSMRVVTPEQVPPDRRYRDAWRDAGDAIALDLPRARALRLAELRRERGPLLEQLDRDWMRATGQKRGADADEIETRRQALRDMPETLEPVLASATTADQLDAVTLP